MTLLTNMALPDLQRLFIILKKIILNCEFSTKVSCAFLLQENIEKLSELNTFKPWKKDNIFPIIDHVSGVQLFCHLVILHGRILKITLTVPSKTHCCVYILEFNLNSIEIHCPL